MQTKMTVRAARKMAAQVNGVIHSRNLYSMGRRYICATALQVEGEWRVYVEDLWSGKQVDFMKQDFVDGYGQPVLF